MSVLIKTYSCSPSSLPLHDGAKGGGGVRADDVDDKVAL